MKFQVKKIQQTDKAQSVNPDSARELYRQMLLIRRFEEKVADLVVAKEIKTPCHLYIGQEAIAVGVCRNLKKDDFIFGTHRSHGHYLAKGGDIKALMAEIYCRKTGCSHGRGGSMHIASPDIGILGTTPIVAGSIPLAVGTALASHIRQDSKVTVAFFGDGATEEGTFHEAMNFAALKKLPLVFVCENNFFSSHLEIHDRQPSDKISIKAQAHNMPSYEGDGNNVLEIQETSRNAIERAREGGGPTLLEYRTYRWRGHVGANWDLELGIRTKETLEKWMERCPIKSFRKELCDAGLLSESDLETVNAGVEQEIEEAYQFAIESPNLDPGDVSKHVYHATKT